MKIKNVSYYTKVIRQLMLEKFYERKDIKLNRHIVIIESDDWGSIRMPSLTVLNKLLSSNVEFPLELGFDRFDTLATQDDLELLMDVLSSIKDINGNPAKLTMNCVMANPDFNKIKKNDFTKYFFEPFTETLKNTPNCQNSFNLWIEGLSHNVFKQQFHGREHLNAVRWLRLLKEGNKNVQMSFNEGVFSMNVDTRGLMSAFNVELENDMNFVANSIKEGLMMFEKTFDYKSLSMIAPCYIWDGYVEEVCADLGVRYLQGSRAQTHSRLYSHNNGVEYECRYMGERNKLNQIYLIRNCSFEPSQGAIFTNDYCLQQIKAAFKHNLPAIISSHRLNYIGALSIKNRDENLKNLKRLLFDIKKLYHDVEFYSSDELGMFYQQKNIC